MKSVETGITLWRTPDGLEFFKVEVRAEPRRGGAKFHGSYHWDVRTLAYARGNSLLLSSKSEAKRQAQADVGEVRTARSTGRSAATNAVRAKRRVTVAAFLASDGEFDRWLKANQLDSTARKCKEQARTLIAPLLGDLYLAEIDDELIDSVRKALRRPRCVSCEARQQREKIAHAKEQRPMKRHGGCGPNCGYGVPRTMVKKFVSALGTMFKAAKAYKYIDRHPLRGGGLSGEFKYNTGGRARTPKRTDPADVLVAFPYLGLERALAAALALFLMLRPQELLALYFHDLLERDRSAPSGVRARPDCRIVKSISHTDRKGFHLVDGCEVPLHVTGRLKTSTENDSKERFPQLWPQLGELAIALWLARGKPPLATPIFVSASGPNRGCPPVSPSDWAQTHFRPAVEFCGLTYGGDDTFYSLRHIGANLLAIGPRWTPHQISVFMGNSPEVALKVYEQPVHLPQYADLQMPEIIDVALRHARLPSLVEIDYAAAAEEMATEKQRARALAKAA